MSNEMKWAAVSLDNLTEDETPITYGVVKPGEEGDILFVRGGDIAGGRILINQLRTINAEVSRQYRRTLLRGGEILVSLVGNPGQVAISPPELAGANIARQVGLVRLKQGIDARFVSYFLQSHEGQTAFSSQSLGSVQQVINLRDLKTVKVPLPPLAEQKAIAAVLGALDDKIELNRRMNATLEAMARALLQSWFVDFDPVHANAGRVERLLDHANKASSQRSTLPGLDPATAALFPDAFQDSSLGPIPKGWDIVTFGQFVERLTVGQKYDQKSALSAGLVPILDQGKSGVIGFHNETPGVIASQEKPVIVFANHTCYMRLITHPFSAIQNVLPFIGDKVDTLWAYFATEGRLAFREYKGHWPDFALEKAIRPSRELTEDFGRRVKPFVSKIDENKNQSRTLATLRDTLLPKLLSGELSAASVAATLETVT